MFQALHAFRELVLPHGYKGYNRLFSIMYWPSSLPSSVSQSTINSVNRELAAVSTVSQSDDLKSRGEYFKVCAKERAVIGKYTAKNGITATICYFKQNG